MISMDLDSADHRDAGLDRAAPHAQQHTDLLDDPLPCLGHRQGIRLGQSLRSGGVGIDRIGLPVPASGPSGPDDLADLDPLAHEVPGQAGAVGAGTLDTGPRADQLDDKRCWLSIAYRVTRADDEDASIINVTYPCFSLLCMAMWSRCYCR
ncbi:hypothetical protein RF647_05135 [Kocuria sp. CPCC 205263]